LSPAKVNIILKLENLLSILSNLRIKVQWKLKILKLYVYSQMRFDLKTYNLGVTWIDENLDAIVVRYIRKWLEIPISACVKEMMTLPKQNGGLAIPSLVNLFESEIGRASCRERVAKIMSRDRV